MERSEPALVPEWLKKTGTGSVGLASHSDERTTSNLSGTKPIVNSNGDFGRSFSSVKTTSSYFNRSSSSNGSGHVRSRNNFSRNQNRHGRDYDRGYNSLDKNRHGRDFSDVQGNTLFGKFEKKVLHPSQSMVSGKHGDTWHHKAITDSSTPARNIDVLPSKGNPLVRVGKVTFERDFPLLGAEDIAVTSQVGRVPSPGLSSAIQSLPISSSAINSDAALTSVLAEVPLLVGSTGTGMSSRQVAPSSASSVALSTPLNLNMAEAVAQGPKCAQITPQLSVETQRLEELAIKQSRQLIPVIPSMQKTLVSSSSDKQKTKVGQHPSSSSFAVNHGQRSKAPLKSDALKPSNVGKLHVLKPVREKNSGSPVIKDSLSLRNGASTLNAASSTPPCDALNGLGHESKPAFTLMEKRPSSQAQSRNDFFNSVRRKSMGNSSPVADSSASNLCVQIFPTKSIENSESDISSAVPAETGVGNAPITSQDGDCSDGINPSGSPLSEMVCVVHGNDGAKTGDKLPTFDPVFPEEEEAAFLRSLGWEENADEVALTEEEIDAFFRKFTKDIKSKPSPKLPQVGPKFLLPFKPHAVGIRSSDAKLES